MEQTSQPTQPTPVEPQQVPANSSQPQTTTATQGVKGWKTALTLIGLLLFFPLGIIFMFIWMKWPIWLKLVILFIGGLLWLVLLIPFTTAALLVINPAKSMTTARDARRAADVMALGNAINATVIDINASASLASGLCPAGQQVCEVSSAGFAQTASMSDGTGWIPVNLSKYLASLPVDPLNTDQYRYVYCSDGKDWELNATLEKPENQFQMTDDGGDTPSRFEVGTNLNLCTNSGDE